MQRQVSPKSESNVQAWLNASVMADTSYIDAQILREASQMETDQINASGRSIPGVIILASQPSNAHLPFVIPLLPVT